MLWSALQFFFPEKMTSLNVLDNVMYLVIVGPFMDLLGPGALNRNRSGN
jgi:hypothetical protein